MYEIRSFIVYSIPMNYCIGIDEAGRGPLAGPVTAAAVVLPDDFPRELLRDSKQLSAKKRSTLEMLIREQASCWALGWASHRTIDQLNIHYATLLAMERAFFALPWEEKWNTPVIIDGSYTLSLPHTDMKAQVGGDRLVCEVMAASILAKEARDRWMIHASQRYPHWGFDRHKGYPTQAHRTCCATEGLSPIHRRSFRISPCASS